MTVSKAKSERIKFVIVRPFAESEMTFATGTLNNEAIWTFDRKAAINFDSKYAAKTWANRFIHQTDKWHIKPEREFTLTTAAA